MSKDTLNRYLFDNADVRGQIVQLEKSYQEILAAHTYPAAIQGLLGELMAATSLLTATLKFDGDISVQVQGTGPVSLAVINGNNLQQLRGVSRWDGDIPADADIAQLMGQGHMVITLTPTNGERYQGVVALDKPTLAECLEQYFAQSEQLPTAIRLFANGKQAAGMLLQVLPGESDHNAEFEHLEQLTSTIKAEELFELDATEVLHRLYHQEEVRLFDPIDVTFSCTCSRERSGQALRTVAKAELDSILAEQGKIDMGCEYCNSNYSFDSIDVEALFNNAPTSDTQQ
ncbi:33 kDa chaperonin [Shewanella colwelliana]|uniref:33 kDa chaperonin n=1 Tax=Shewanella colwelliana TaxID=23 RepID=A0A1E5IWE5_SHECO|nr:Hsp33 family molecular chaperone HslO [Shewanella colwelliana]MDX1280734.1 Hsp33 family molecular chaperone HslO [Shewanella colwelliana]OEG74844.1 Hsp33 family molecular chaperone [Shewanella colwelliana]GIU19426.1 33 kDa chaperonin [Shewanella colwelliana]GIU42374.1 33 kDa chaperonin [Shewanella colwelliana]